eukprot:GEMP01070184.1.p1 GENE.GEMP01070184.1~~GEMP01070184.1.p1  ORF type:complete len:245 (+),score=53.67 GEMP01070184.1:49-783(+)
MFSSCFDNESCFPDDKSDSREYGPSPRYSRDEGRRPYSPMMSQTTYRAPGGVLYQHTKRSDGTVVWHPRGMPIRDLDMNHPAEERLVGPAEEEIDEFGNKCTKERETHAIPFHRENKQVLSPPAPAPVVRREAPRVKVVPQITRRVEVVPQVAPRVVVAPQVTRRVVVAPQVAHVAVEPQVAYVAVVPQVTYVAAVPQVAQVAVIPQVVTPVVMCSPAAPQLYMVEHTHVQQCYVPQQYYYISE